MRKREGKREERKGGGEKGRRKESKMMRGVENRQRVEMRPRELLKQEREREKRRERDSADKQLASCNTLVD